MISEKLKSCIKANNNDIFFDRKLCNLKEIMSKK